MAHGKQTNGERWTWDFFVTYAAADGRWAVWIAWQLEAAGYRVLIAEWDSVPGTRRTQHVVDGLDRAERTLAVLSEAYLRIDAEGVWQAAFRRDPLALERRLLPVRVEDCQLPALLDDVVSIDLFGRSAEDAHAELMRGIRTSLDGRARPPVAPQFPHGQQLFPDEPLPAGTPYRRLDFFGPEHVDYYFGREDVTDELLSKLGREDLVVLVGTSGSGKSSLVRAGLRKGLAGTTIVGLTDRDQRLFTPGSSPLADLDVAVPGLFALLAGQAASGLADPAREPRHGDAEAPATRIAAAIRDLAPPDGLLLIVDQFERVFIDCQDEAERTRFIDTLLAAAGGGGTVKVLIVLRADFYGQAMRHLELSIAVKAGQVTVVPMTSEEMRAAIERPAAVLGRRFETSLVEELLADVEGQAGALPLLEFTLAELWSRNEGRALLTQASYDQLGSRQPGGQRMSGVRWAIAQAAHEVWRGLSPAERDILPRMFRDLVAHIGAEDGDRKSGRYVSRRVWHADWDAAARAVAGQFVAARLLVSRTDAANGQPVFELAHEALTEAWPALRNWLEKSGPFDRWLADNLVPAYRRWFERERADDFLLPDLLVRETQDWLQRYPEGLRGPVLEYATRSIDAHERRRSAERTRQQQLEDALRVAEEQRARAEQGTREANALLWATRARQETDDSLAVALALAAADGSDPPPFAQQVLAEIAYRPGPRRRLAFGHSCEIWCVALRGDIVVTGADDGTVLVWDLTGDRPPRSLQGHAGAVRGVALSADGRTAVSGGEDRQVIVWDVECGAIRRRLDGHDDAVRAVALNGGLAVTGSADRSVIVWDVHTGSALRRLTGHDDVVTAVAASAGTILSGSADGSLIRWDLDSGRAESRRDGAHAGSVWSVALDAEGASALSGGSDCAVWHWDLVSAAPRLPWSARRLSGHAGSVWTVAFTGDGRGALSGASDRSIICWDLASGEPVRQLTGHAGAVNGIAVDPLGPTDPAEARFVSVADDRALTLWAGTAGEPLLRLRGHGAAPTCGALSADGSIALTGAADGTLIIWDVTAACPSRHLRGHDAGVLAAVLGADGRIALTGAWDGTVMVWDTATGEPVRRLGDPIPGGAGALAIDADGRFAVTGSSDGTLAVWDAITGVLVDESSIWTGAITSLSMSASGAMVVAGTDEPAVVVVDWESGRIRSLRTDAPVVGVAMDAHGRTAFARSADHALISIDLDRDVVLDLGEQVSPASRGGRHTESGSAAAAAGGGLAVSGDGRNILIVEDDGQTTLWDAATGSTHVLAGVPSGGRPGSSPVAEGRSAASVLALSADGTTALSGGAGEPVVVWNTTRATLLRRIDAHDAPVNRVVLSRDGRTMLSSADRDGRNDGAAVALWDLDTGQPIQRWRMEEPNGIALSADGTIAIAASDELALLRWETRSTRPARALGGHTEAVTTVALSPDGRTAVSGAVDHRVILWNVAAGEFVRCLGVHNAPVRTVALADDGRLAASGGDDRVIMLWEVRAGALAQTLIGHRAAVSALAFGPTGRILGSGSAEGALFVWDLDTGVRHPCTGHRDAIVDLAFSRDGRTLMSAAADGSVIGWDVTTRQPTRLLAGSGVGVGQPGPSRGFGMLEEPGGAPSDRPAAVGPETPASALCLDTGLDRDGSVVAVGAQDGTVSLWRLHSRAELAAWTRDRRLVRVLSCEEREAHNMEPLCDEQGNLPPRPQPHPEVAERPEPVTSLTLGPAPAVPPPPAQTDQPLEPGSSHFDAVQEGRTRTWRVEGRRGDAIAITVAPEGIDLEPVVDMYGPFSSITGRADERVRRRVQVGPFTLPATGTYRVVVRGLAGTGGGYTITCRRPGDKNDE